MRLDIINAIVLHHRRAPLRVMCVSFVPCMLLREFYESVCRETASRRENNQEQLVERILAYIRANLSDDSLCLRGVAHEFKMSEKYMSQFIHKRAGITFSGFLEGERIKVANNLPAETELSVQEISERTGYLNANTFRRAYQRVTGFSPSRYRAALADEKRNKQVKIGLNFTFEHAGNMMKNSALSDIM